MVPSESLAPSDSPSEVPTRNPSLEPSASPSTGQPSVSPTSAPSNFPSFAPTTSRPTISPSALPSSTPTDYCHDVANYRSPINGFSCADHNGTDCTQWRFLGLTVDEVEELIDNCPISCQVECGSSRRFETTLSFRLWNIDTFLSPSAVMAMNDVAIDYMTTYVSSLEPDSTFFLDETVLISQQFANTEPDRRVLQEEFTSKALRIDLEIRGYAIKLDQATIESRLQDALFTPEFTLALQRSGDATFTNTKVDKVGGSIPVQVEVDDLSQGVSPGGISAAVLASFVVILAAGGYAFHYKRKHDQIKVKLRDNREVFNNFPLSPNQSIISPASSFSRGISRIVASFSPRSADDEEATKSADLSASSDSNDTNDIASSQLMMSEGNRIDEGDEEASSEQEEEEEEEPIHPYTGIIPPMIVIDCIENDPEVYLDMEVGTTKVKSIVPSMRLHASSDLVAALNDKSKPFDPEAFSSFIQSNTPVSIQEEIQKSDEKFATQNSESSFNVFSSEDDEVNDDNSTKTSNVESSDALFDRLLEGDLVEEEISAYGSGRMDFRVRNPFSIPLMTRPPRVPSDGTQRLSPVSAHSSPIIPREKSAVDGYFSDDANAKERVSHKETPSFLHSLWNKSSNSRNPSSIPPKREVFGESKKRWGGHMRSNSRSSFGTNTSLEDEGTMMTFQAPKGKLGLVLECSTESTPIIAKVKDYSPLLDQVLPGDKIVMIDNTPTDKMGMRDVMSLLEGKITKSTSVRLKVFRPITESLDGSLVHHVRSPAASHLSFDGSASMGTTSDQDSPIGLKHKNAGTIKSSTHSIISHPVPPPPPVPAPTGVKRSRSETDVSRPDE